MAADLSVDGFCESAQNFAKSALQAHYTKDYQRVALDAGTALEHLAKAALYGRSPALLSELRGEGSFPHLLRLLDISKDKASQPLRTVSLRNALERVEDFITSHASRDDLKTLVDLRDGTVHAALADAVEERVVVAFLQHADALLDGLGRDRAGFWGEQVAVVDALVSDVTDKVAHDVAVKIAQAEAFYMRWISNVPEEVVDDAIAARQAPEDPAGEEVPTKCPACGWLGSATGSREVQWFDDEADEEGAVFEPAGTVWFRPSWFGCDVCGLRLESPAEIHAAGMGWEWQREHEDPLQWEQRLAKDRFRDDYRDSY